MPGIEQQAAGALKVITMLLLSALIMGVGLCVAGAGTHLYQWISSERAMLRYDGRNFVGAMGNLVMSFVCGPYIMLHLGWTHEDDGTLSLSSALIAAMVAFGWAFITGLLFLGVYVALPL